MFAADWSGQWSRGRLMPYGPIAIAPGARALQYAELVFEGLKAYRVGAGAQTCLSAGKLAGLHAFRGAVVDAAGAGGAVLSAIDAVVASCLDVIPRQSGRSLYLRPFLFGTEAGYLIRNSATFTFMVIANPVEPYSSGAMRVAIERGDVRAAVGGVGAAKTAANYAASLRASTSAAARGMTVTLWLDAQEHRWIQELSGMNLFAVIGGALHTPSLDGAILPGVTRDSLLRLGAHLGYEVVERRMAIDELLAQIESGECTELFACGTAAIVSPIAVLSDSVTAEGGEGGRRREYAPRRVDAGAATLRDALLAIQERRAPDIFHWTRDVPPLPAGPLPGGT